MSFVIKCHQRQMEKFQNQIEVLESMGRWLKKNGESIYGQRHGIDLRGQQYNLKVILKTEIFFINLSTVQKI